MSGDFWLGLAVIPVLALLAALVVVARWFILYRIQRLKAAHPERRAHLAGRMFGSKRGYTWDTDTFAVAVTVGFDLAAAQRAQAALLDEFVPLTDETAGVRP